MNRASSLENKIAGAHPPPLKPIHHRQFPEVSPNAPED